MRPAVQEPVSRRSASSRHAVHEIVAERPLRVSAELADELFARFGVAPDHRSHDTSFELESHGGYARVVSGTVEYLDEEAKTFMVRTPSGDLLRVPIRDVISAGTSNADAEQRFHHDSDGLGSGDVALGGWPSARGGRA